MCTPSLAYRSQLLPSLHILQRQSCSFVSSQYKLLLIHLCLLSLVTMELEESSQASPETGEVAQHPPTPRNLSNSVTGSAPSTFAFLSLPAELRASILTACIRPNHDRKESDKPRCLCSWYLSHTMPQSLFGVSRQLREEALCVLST